MDEPPEPARDLLVAVRALLAPGLVIGGLQLVPTYPIFGLVVIYFGFAVGLAEVILEPWFLRRHYALQVVFVGIVLTAWTAFTISFVVFKPRLTVEVAPIVLIRPREPYKEHGQVIRAASYYGFAVVLRVSNKSSEDESVRKLQVRGDVGVSYADYEMIFAEPNQNHASGYLSDEWQHRRPFFRLLWTAYPVGRGDQEFMKFVFLEPAGLERVTTDNAKDYVGFRYVQGLRLPKLLVTSPYLWDVATPTSVSRDRMQFDGWKLREELKDGDARFVVDIGDKEVIVPLRNVRSCEDVVEHSWNSATAQDLFYGTTDIFRKANPVPVPNQ